MSSACFGATPCGATTIVAGSSFSPPIAYGSAAAERRDSGYECGLDPGGQILGEEGVVEGVARVLALCGLQLGLLVGRQRHSGVARPAQASLDIGVLGLGFVHTLQDPHGQRGAGSRVGVRSRGRHVGGVAGLRATGLVQTHPALGLQLYSTNARLREEGGGRAGGGVGGGERGEAEACGQETTRGEAGGHATLEC